ncbi:MAG: alpha/beta hydrolase family protein [Promethearchaeota archaeon]
MTSNVTSNETYYAYLDDESLVDEHQTRLILKEAWDYSRTFAGKGEPDLDVISGNFNNLEEWEARAALVRAGILEGLGLTPLPPPEHRPPLNPVLHSRRERASGGKRGYSVENYSIEILPGFFATGNLYRPIPRVPGELHSGVLLPHGHAKEGRFADRYQYLGATLARLGCTCLTYDMQGYGEATQVEHGGEHVGSFQAWQSMRVLDFLLGLDGVDPDRIACTGCSGGGTQTFLLTALDDRVRLSVPVTMVSSVFFGGCSCESGLPIHKNAVDGRHYATNNAEIAAMASWSPRGPRPLLLVCVGGDWTALVPIREYPFIRDVYSLYGPGATRLVEFAYFPEEQHDYGPSKRQATYGFIAKHFHLPHEDLLTPDGLISEGETVIEAPEALMCFTESHPRPARALEGHDAVLEALRSTIDRR